MEIQKFNCEGLLLITPDVFSDNRGYFLETFNEKKYKEIGILKDFVQDNESLSALNVVRGLHFQCPPYSQGKLVRIVNGSILDIAVDLRKKSATYGKWVAVNLSGKNKKQFWIPEGFAHGFISLEDNTIVNYKCTSHYNPDSEKTILWNDPTLNIDWKNESNKIVSEKDNNGVFFADFISPF